MPLPAVQTEAIAVTVAVGSGLMMTVSVTVVVQIPNVYANVYAVVSAGATVIVGVVAVVFHRYVPPVGETRGTSVAL